jgi:hypothetical protein
VLLMRRCTPMFYVLQTTLMVLQLREVSDACHQLGGSARVASTTHVIRICLSRTLSYFYDIGRIYKGRPKVFEYPAWANKNPGGSPDLITEFSILSVELTSLCAGLNGLIPFDENSLGDDDAIKGLKEHIQVSVYVFSISADTDMLLDLVFPSDRVLRGQKRGSSQPDAPICLQGQPPRHSVHVFDYGKAGPLSR